MSRFVFTPPSVHVCPLKDCLLPPGSIFECDCGRFWRWLPVSPKDPEFHDNPVREPWRRMSRWRVKLIVMWAARRMSRWP